MIANSFSQNSKYLFMPVMNEDVIDTLLNEQKKFISFIKVDESVLGKDTIECILNKEQFFVKKRTNRNQNSYEYVGINKNDSLILSVVYSNGSLEAFVTKGLLIYRITSDKRGNHYLYQVLQEKFPAEDCGIVFDKGNPLIIPDDRTDTTNIINHTLIEDEVIRTNAFSCKLRVLVAYTNNSFSLVPNMNTFALLAVESTNSAYSNSQINQQLELVCVTHLNYNEVDLATDLDRFAAKSDGYLDEIFTLKNLYSADICVLLEADNSYCGIAKTIYATPEEAFCVVNTDCAIDNCSFAHETGHLLGARHDLYVDDESSPFSYGHGYVYLTGHWRTIMAYNNQCQKNGFNCVRKNYFSNPNVTYNSVPMGNASTCDVARVLKTTILAEINNSNPTTIINLTNDTIKYFADIIAKDKIISSGATTIKTSASANLRARNEVIFTNGFHAEAGSYLSTKVENVEDCCTGEIVPIVKNGALIKLQSCPVTLHFNCAETFSAKVYNMTGSLIAQTSGNVVDNTAIVWSPYSVTTGVYYQIVITLANSVQTKVVTYRVLFTQTCNNDNDIENNSGVIMIPENEEVAEQESTLNSILIYPTLVSNNIHISFSCEKQSNVKITLSNIVCNYEKIIFENEGLQEGNYQYDFDVSNEKQGIYFIFIQINNNTMIQKIVKK